MVTKEDPGPKKYYKQQSLVGYGLSGFRDSDDDPWIWYDTTPCQAVLSFKAGLGNYPLPEWREIDADNV